MEAPNIHQHQGMERGFAQHEGSQGDRLGMERGERAGDQSNGRRMPAGSERDHRRGRGRPTQRAQSQSETDGRLIRPGKSEHDRQQRRISRRSKHRGVGRTVLVGLAPMNRARESPVGLAIGEREAGPRIQTAVPPNGGRHARGERRHNEARGAQPKAANSPADRRAVRRQMRGSFHKRGPSRAAAVFPQGQVVARQRRSLALGCLWAVIGLSRVANDP